MHHTYWCDAIMLCHASGFYGSSFKAGRGVTQGRPLFVKLFNILVDAVAHELFRQLRDDGDYEDDEIEELSTTFFTIFYVNDVYFALRDAAFLQLSLDILGGLFKRVGLQTNTKKTQAMICTPGKIQVQLPVESYRRMQCERVLAAEWNSHSVECGTCGRRPLDAICQMSMTFTR